MALVPAVVAHDAQLLTCETCVCHPSARQLSSLQKHVDKFRSGFLAGLQRSALARKRRENEGKCAVSLPRSSYPWPDNVCVWRNRAAATPEQAAYTGDW